MKTYTIKYETYSGDCRVETVTAYDERSAISQLVNCKRIYWTEQVTEDNKRTVTIITK